MSNKKLVRGALLVALALVLQSLRLVVPMPPLASAFIIGTLVHLMLVMTLKINGIATACLLGLLLPMTAYLQGQLLLPFLIPIVWIGNLLFVILVGFLANNKNLELIIPGLIKAIVMGLSAFLVVNFITILSPVVQNTLMFAMSVPQFITAVLGVFLANRLLKYLSKVV